MALKKTDKTPQGFEAISAYHRVEGISLTGKDKLEFRVRSYKDNSGVAAFGDQGFDCAYDLNGTNPINQAYVFLKTQDAFKDAEDC